MRIAALLVVAGVLAMWWIKRSPRTADPAPRWKPAPPPPPPNHGRTISNNRSRR